MKRIFSGWLRAFLLALLTLPIIYGIKRNAGSFLQPLESLLDISRAESSSLISIWLLMFAVSCLILGQLSQFIRFNTLLLVGMLVTAFGLFMTSCSTSYIEILVWFSIVSGLGFGTAWICCYSTSIRDAYEKKGLSTGINSAMQIGGAALFLVGLRWLIENILGLSGTFTALSIMVAGGGILGYFLASKEKSKVTWFKFDSRLTRFYISVSLVIGISYMQLIHRLPLFKEAGLSIGYLGILALVILLVDSGTEPISGWFFIDKLKNSRMAWILSVVGPIVLGGLLLLALSTGLIGFTLFVILFGIICLCPTPILSAVNYLADGHKEDFAPLMGTTLFFSNISLAVFSWVGGACYTWLGSYELIFLVTSGIALICAFTLKKQ